MSSFPEHAANIKQLEKMGLKFDSSIINSESGVVELESWDYDAQVEIMTMVVEQLIKDNYKVKPE